MYKGTLLRHFYACMWYTLIIFTLVISLSSPHPRFSHSLSIFDYFSLLIFCFCLFPPLSSERKHGLFHLTEWPSVLCFDLLLLHWIMCDTDTFWACSKFVSLRLRWLSLDFWTCKWFLTVFLLQIFTDGKIKFSMLLEILTLITCVLISRLICIWKNYSNHTCLNFQSFA